MNKNGPPSLSMTALHSFFEFIFHSTVVLLSVNSVLCQQSSDVTQITLHLGERLVAGGPNQTWVSSPNKIFTFGFYVIDEGSTSVSYKLGIWYSRLSVQTIVWGLVDNNGSLDAGALITLTDTGNLELQSPNASQGLIWSSNTTGIGVSGATLSDSGNFILLNSTGENLWQSWDVPSDTLLPGQTFPQGRILTAMVSPRLASANVSPYILTLLTDGSLQLFFNGTNSYWSSMLQVNSQAAIASLAYFDTSGDFQLLNSSGTALSYRSSDYGIGPLRRVVVTADGNLETLSWDDVDSKWTSTWSVFPNECEIYGWCGKHGLCKYSETGPVCSCLPGYQAINSKNPRQGCKVIIDLNCTAGLKMVTLKNTFMLEHASDFLINSANSDNCAQRCLSDTGTGNTLECVASGLENLGTAYCREKRSKFFSAYQSPFIAAQTFIKLCVTQGINLDSPSSCDGFGYRNATALVVALTCISGLAGLLLVLLAWPYLGRWKKWKVFESRIRRPRDPNAVNYVPGAPVRLSYKELQKATRNFSEKLGAGGFGTVYKGVLDNTVVAIKQLEDVVEQGEREFRTEVAVIGSTHHVNLVHLYGFCTERAHRLLVYEYLSNGSLDHYLSQGSDMTTTSNSSLSTGSVPSNSTQPLNQLEWETRFAIALGTARGIMYLHEECRECIVHCDIKPENILLDERFCPKVSDFGLAKLLGLRGRERHITTIRGTRGYLAPEWSANLPLTAKADVYSYGIVLLELVVGRRALDVMAGESEGVWFPTWAYRELMDGSLVRGIKMQARKLGQWVDLSQVERTIFTGFWCIQDEPTARPSMGKVVQMLEGTVSIDSPPEPLAA